MRYVALAFTLLTGPAMSADFRVLEIGAPCVDVVAQETALGSQAVPWSPVPGATMLAFEGKAFGGRVLLTYVCTHETLLSGNYYFPNEDLPAAVARYEALHKELSASYGSPELDNSPWMRPLDPRWLQSDSKKYMTTWNTARISVSAGIVPTHPSEPEGWRVFVVYSAAFDRERSNNSMEQTRAR